MHSNMDHKNQQSIQDQILISLPSSSIPLSSDEYPPHVKELLLKIHNEKSELLETYLSCNCLVQNKYKIDLLELECLIQPQYNENDNINESLLSRNKLYHDRRQKTIFSQQNNENKNLSNNSLLLNNTNFTFKNISSSNDVKHEFNSNSFKERKNIAKKTMLPRKRLRIDPNDYIYRKLSIEHESCDSYIDINSEEYLYNNDLIDNKFVSPYYELIQRPNKKSCIYNLEYGKIPKPIDELTKLGKQWGVLAREDVYHEFRSHLNTRNYLVGLAKKTSINCQREVKKKVLQSVRQGKDAGNRGKKLSREVMTYWRKQDKEQRGAIIKAQRVASQMRKRDDEIREAKRQQKKLNFLLTQTELYAHFIGKKTEIQSNNNSSSNTTIEDDRSIPKPQLEDNELTMEAIKATEKVLEETKARMEAFDKDTLLKKKKLGINVKKTLSPSKNQLPVIISPNKNINTMPTLVSQPNINNNNNNNSSNNIDDNEFKIQQPSIFSGTLKNYQIRGLNWLVNLYDQGINGILADDMGLGKTIQTIAFLGHLAEEKDIWGPFLVIAPVSTLHNWHQEIKKFTPSFNAIPYWGKADDRKILRRYWTPSNMYTKDAAMHVVITSYQLVVQDEKYFRRVKWQYMILDEAHAIKASSSVRWKTLLGFHCRNRLLLTGTPIQNNMAELWSLLHFIMPSFFDSHEEFNDWFSKDIENHAEGSGAINEQQLSRLHTILKPFMLRRVKKDIADEMVKKYEVEQPCYLTERQKRLYHAIKAKIPISYLLSQAKSDSSQHLMNLVMQFRKVCNHPELFERRGVISPFQFLLYVNIPLSNTNPINIYYPKFLYRNEISNDNYNFNNRHISNSLLKYFNIYSSNYIESTLNPSSIYNHNNHNNNNNNNNNHSLMVDDDYSNSIQSPFSFLRFCDLSIQEGSYLFQNDLFHQNNFYQNQYEKHKRIIISSQDFSSHNDNSCFLIRELKTIRKDENSILWNQGVNNINFIDTIKAVRTYSPAAVASPIILSCPDRSFSYNIHNLLYNGTNQHLLFGNHFIPSIENPIENDIISYNIKNNGLLTSIHNIMTTSKIFIPGFNSVINDSGKLKTLDQLLAKLKAEGHCVLIYSQMTKMLDILEEYLNFRKYSYHRLDGASKLSERRDMVSDFQNNGAFVFLLSTRAGGIGINLTAADTVIFYDSDWNPTMDDQAMDRAHRLGQTRPVTVYRFVTKNSIEERILARAKEKHNIQSIVIAGGKFEAGAFSSANEVVSLLLNDNEMEKPVLPSKRNKRKSLI